MKRIILLFTVAAMTAVMLMSMSAGPASALVIGGDNEHDNDHNNKFFFDRNHDDFFDFDRDGDVSLDIGDVENESGDVELDNNFSIEGSNNNACLGQQQFGQTGNFTNQQGVLQSGGGVFVDDDNNDRDHNWNWWNRDNDNDWWNHNRNWWNHDDDNDRVFFGDAQADDIEFEGPEVTFAPANETTCDQDVQQSSAASSWGW